MTGKNVERGAAAAAAAYALVEGLSEDPAVCEFCRHGVGGLCALPPGKCVLLDALEPLGRLLEDALDWLVPPEPQTLR